MKNISWLFYKDYFDDLSYDKSNGDSAKIKAKNAAILAAPLFKIPHYLQYKEEGKTKFSGQTIRATIQYPGIATGIGINHEAKVEGEFKLGVHFDYTYGMPVIYGSSVKGLLRSAFPESEAMVNRGEDSKKREKLRTAKIELILGYLGKTLDVDKLRDQIFEGLDKNEAGKIAPLSIYKRDIFFDAVIVKEYTKNETSRILESDSITPHYKDLLKDPVPITFLRIASGVEMEFRFNLHDTEINGITISAKEKRDLFCEILNDFGVGAKTNVGYGQLIGKVEK